METNGPNETGSVAGEYVVVPREILTQLNRLGDEGLRVLLVLLLAEQDADQPGISLPVAELAERGGLGVERARLAARRLAVPEVNWIVEMAPDQFALAWGLPPATEDPSPDGEPPSP